MPRSFTASLNLNEQFMARAKEMLKGAPKRFPQHRVTVGLHEDEGSQSKIGYNGQSTDSTLATVAAIHEFGAGKLPERSWLRSWFDRNEARFKTEMTEAMKSEYEGDDEAVAKLGHKWGLEVRAFIEEQQGQLAALSPKTINKKAKFHLPDPGIPLYATGQLIAAIKARIDGADA